MNIQRQIGGGGRSCYAAAGRERRGLAGAFPLLGGLFGGQVRGPWIAMKQDKCCFLDGMDAVIAAVWSSRVGEQRLLRATTTHTHTHTHDDMDRLALLVLFHNTFSVTKKGSV